MAKQEYIWLVIRLGVVERLKIVDRAAMSKAREQVRVEKYNWLPIIWKGDKYFHDEASAVRRAEEGIKSRAGSLRAQLDRIESMTVVIIER